MAKNVKKYRIVLEKDDVGNVQAESYMEVGSSDDAELIKGVSKLHTLSAGDQADADALYASLEAELKSDEGIV